MREGGGRRWACVMNDPSVCTTGGVELSLWKSCHASKLALHSRRGELRQVVAHTSVLDTAI